MSNQHNQPEQQAAHALDDLLNKLQSGRTVTRQDAVTPFAQKLVSLVDEVEPRPEFEHRLRAKLLAQAQPKQKQMNLLEKFEEGLRRSAMKRLLLSAVGLTAVLVIAFFTWSTFLAPPIPVEPGAGIAAIPDVDTASDASSSDVIVEQAAEEAALNQRGGFGGGGFGFGEGGPFTNATLTLNADLPEATEAAIYAGSFRDAPVDLEQLRRFAEQMNVEGDVYFEWYMGMPIDGTDDGSGNVPQIYRIFDGQRMVSGFRSGEMFYEDTALFQQQNSQTPLPFAERAAIAEQFLQERRLLDGGYEMHAGWGNEVQFLATVDGRAVYNWVAITVNVLPDGQIMTVSIRPLPQMSQTEVEALRSANDAYTYLQENLDNGLLMFNIIPTNPEYFAFQSAPSGQKTHWEVTYEPGQQVSLNSWLQIFRPADGNGTLRLMTNQGMVLTGAEGMLESIAQDAAQGRYISLEGTVEGEPGRLQLNVESWGIVNGPSDLYLNGTTRNRDGIVYLELPGGFPIEVANPPADLPMDATVGMSTWGVRIADDGVSAITDWITLDLNEYREGPMEEPFIDPYSNISAVTIDAVDLAYFYLYPGEPVPFTNVPFAHDGDGRLIPVWRFTGSTNNGDLVEFAIPALASIELPEPPTE